MKRGLFITFEGGEGAGKSIQVEILTSHLREKGYAVIVTREPGGTRIGEQIRAITHNPENVDMEATTEAYLMAAARAQHVAQVIEPAIEAGKIVVCDRYVDSSIAYQGYGRNLKADFISKLNAFAIDGLMPDVTFLLMVDLQTGAARRKNSSKTDRLDLQRQAFYEAVAKGYESLATKEPKRFVLIDANPEIDEIATNIWTHVEQFIKTHDIQKTK